MVRSLITLAAVILSLGAAEMSRGAALLTLSHGSSGVAATPGGTFQFDVFLVIEGSEQVVGFDYYLEGSGLFYDGNFLILDRVSNLTFFDELTTPDAAVVTPEADAWLNPYNARSLGALVSSLTPVSGAGNYLLATFTISVDALALPGQYSISPINTLWVNQDFDDQSFQSLGSLSITVVPEPGAAVMLLAASTVLLFRRRR